MRFLARFQTVFGVGLCAMVAVFAVAVWAQHKPQTPAGHAGHMEGRSTPLTAPGNDVFGTIQEVIRELEAAPDTDWSRVDLEALRQHLIDMNNFTLHVDVVSREPLPDGVRIRIHPTTPEARASLKRVLAAHPRQLHQETGWKMDVAQTEGGYELLVTTPKAGEVAKIQGLGYIGLMAYGSHHQKHHWMIATGQHPHAQK